MLSRIVSLERRCQAIVRSFALRLAHVLKVGQRRVADFFVNKTLR
ncbi:MAG: hypothetical protein ACJAYB_003287 [Psychromonas sp.]|jgi:hypothetical protein